MVPLANVSCVDRLVILTPLRHTSPSLRVFPQGATDPVGHPALDLADMRARHAFFLREIDGRAPQHSPAWHLLLC
jgi:hypothetical protein